MEPWIEGIRRILMRIPTGALAFSRILEELSLEGMGQPPDPLWLLKTISDRKDLFRIVHLARGPWALLNQVLAPGMDPGRGAPMRDDPWVLLLRPPESGFGAAESVTARMRECLLAWGRTVDDSSPPSVARWIRANLEGSRALATLVNGKSPKR